MRAEQLHQKLGLVQQLKTLARQHEQILQAYERKVQEKLQEGSLAVAAGGKRAGPPLVAEGPEAKRHRQLAERASRKNELWNEVVKIVEKIRKNTKSEPFRQPVDPIKLKIPDYLNVISKPMDLGTVLKKLRSKPLGYTQPQEVAEDVRQIWTNCRTYNGLNHPVSQAANTCSEAFEKSWGQANIEQRWEVEMMREQREEQAFAGGEAEAADDNIVNQLRYKRNMLGDLIAAKDVQDNLPPGSLGDLVPERDMTFEEKRKLSAHMASLPGEKLVHVLDIISEAENLQADGDGEVEVDIDALHNNTLWKLKAYVDGVLTATSGPPPKKSANRSAPNKQGPPAAAAAAAGGMPPPPPPVAASQPGLPLPQQQSAPQQQQQPLATGAMPPPPQQPPQFQQPQPVQPPVQQQQQQSPVHSGGQSAQEVVGSTAGGPGAARSHQFTYDMGTVAQSGTNARPSNFVMGKARQSTPTADAAGAAAAAGDQPAQTGPTHMDAGTAEQWEAALKGGEGEAPAAAAAAGATDAAAGAAPAAAGEAAAAATPSAPAADEPAAAGDAATAEPAAAADAVVAAPAEAPAAPEAAAAASAAADEVPAAPAAADEAPAPPAAAAAAAAAAGDGSGDVDLWDKFASAAAQEENKLKQEQEKAQREKKEAEEQQRLKAEQEQQKQQQEKDARAAEIFGGMGGAGATGASDDAVHADVEKLLNCAPAAAPAAAGGASSTPPLAAAAAAAAAGEGDGPDAMDVDTEEEKQQEEAEDDDGEPADGGGFD